MAAMRAWHLEDRADRDRLRSQVQELGQLLQTLRTGLDEYENDNKQEDQE